MDSDPTSPGRPLTVSQVHSYNCVAHTRTHQLNTQDRLSQAMRKAKQSMTLVLPSMLKPNLSLKSYQTTEQDNV